MNNTKTLCAEFSASASQTGALRPESSSPTQGVTGAELRERMHKDPDAVDNDTVGGGLIRTAGSNAALQHALSEKKRKEQKKFARDAQDLNEYLDQIADIIAALHNQLAEQLILLGRINDMIDGLERGELPEQNPDGSFADKGVEAKFQAYEKHTGKKVDRNDPVAVLNAMLVIEHWLNDDVADTRQQIKDKQKILDAGQRQLTAARADEDVPLSAESAVERLSAYVGGQATQHQQDDLTARVDQVSENDEVLGAFMLSLDDFGVEPPSDTDVEAFSRDIGAADQIADVTARAEAQRAIIAQYPHAAQEYANISQDSEVAQILAQDVSSASSVQGDNMDAPQGDHDYHQRQGAVMKLS